jgi:hypothetical protein
VPIPGDLEPLRDRYDRVALFDPFAVVVRTALRAAAWTWLLKTTLFGS